MDNDIENQIVNNQIKKLSCVVCKIIIAITAYK